MSAYRKIIQLLTGCRWGRTKWGTFTAWAGRPTSAVSRFFVNNSRASLFPFSNYLVYTLSSVFVWNQEGIGDSDFDQTIRQFWKMYREQLANGGNGDHKLNGSNGNNGGLNGDDDEWEEVIIKEQFQVYRKLLSKDSYLYQYKIFGTFKDIPAKAFFLVQLDTAFRKTWDRLVVKLDIVDSEGNHIHTSQGNDVDYEDLLDDCIQSRESFDSKNQVVHWVMHYPYPMYCRDYCYVRRAKIDRENNLMILAARSTDHPSCNDNGTINGKQKYVRVNTYDSRMVIRPHSTFDENGFDYLLTYFDDPQSNFPSAAYNWMACSGVPDFVNKLYDAAVKLNQRSQERRKEKELRKTHRRQEEEELTRIQEEVRRERERRQKEQQEREEKEDELTRQQRIWQEQERLRKRRMREKSFAQLGSGHLVIRDNRKYGHYEDRNEFVKEEKTVTMTPLNKEKTEIENVDRVPNHHPLHPTEEEPSSATITQSTSSSSSSQNNSSSSTMVSSVSKSPSQNKTTTSTSTSAQTAPSSSPSTGTTLYQF